jgi:hypothetical protein
MSSTAAGGTTPGTKRPTVLKPVWQADRLPIVAALLATLLPGFVTSFVLASSGGDVRPVSVLAAVTVLLVAALAWRFTRTRLQLDGRGIIEYRLFLPARRITTGQVASAVMLTLYDDETLRQRRQLFLLDAEERTVLRLRGGSWTDAQISAVARHVDVAVRTFAEPVTLRQLRRDRARQLSWQERHPIAVVAVLVAVVVPVCVTVATVVTVSIR